jgi:hypothetical protein
MATLVRREARGPLDIFDWLEAPWTILRPVAGHPVRVEDYVEDGRYVVRAIYDNGILEIAMAIASKNGEVSRKIPVMLDQHIKAT